jgi:hypothetical protein
MTQAQATKTAQQTEVIVLSANMGSCECGNVYVVVIIDHESKGVYVPVHHSWMSGDVKNGHFVVPYAGKVKIPEKYKIFRYKNKAEWELSALAAFVKERPELTGESLRDAMRGEITVSGDIAKFTIFA